MMDVGWGENAFFFLNNLRIVCWWVGGGGIFTCESRWQILTFAIPPPPDPSQCRVFDVQPRRSTVFFGPPSVPRGSVVETCNVSIMRQSWKTSCYLKKNKETWHPPWLPWCYYCRLQYNFALAGVIRRLSSPHKTYYKLVSSGVQLGLAVGR